MSFTAEERAALEAELKARGTYAWAVEHRGPDAYLVKLRPGWGARTWDGADPIVCDRKVTARKRVVEMAAQCRKRVDEIGTQLLAAEFDAERAAVSLEERLAAATAERDAMGPIGFAPRGHTARRPLRIDPKRAIWSRRKRIA